MRYHNITKDDMLNGDGLRVVLWLSGCEHHCKGCQNPITWDPGKGLPFDSEAFEEVSALLKKDYISGLTLSGGDPLARWNKHQVSRLVKRVKYLFSDKTIWVYTGYTWEECRADPTINRSILPYIDVLVDGEYVEELRDVTLKWKGSANQRVINVPETLRIGRIVLVTEG